MSRILIATIVLATASQAFDFTSIFDFKGDPCRFPPGIVNGGRYSAWSCESAITKAKKFDTHRVVLVDNRFDCTYDGDNTCLCEVEDSWFVTKNKYNRTARHGRWCNIRYRIFSGRTMYDGYEHSCGRPRPEPDC